LHNAPSRKTKYIFEPSLGTKFNCLTEAQEFYNIYSWEAGFGTKKGDKREGRMQEFHCQCKVIKKQFALPSEHVWRTIFASFKKLIKRSCFLCMQVSDNCVQYKTMKKKCPAMVRLRRTEDFGWYVSEYRADHNHPLAES
jgi:hypothetical protein